MLRTIMTTDVEYDLLREEGVSEEAIDFVSRLLRTDPHERPTERELFKHPWIADVADVDEYPVRVSMRILPSIIHRFRLSTASRS